MCTRQSTWTGCMARSARLPRCVYSWMQLKRHCLFIEICPMRFARSELHEAMCDIFVYEGAGNAANSSAAKLADPAAVRAACALSCSGDDAGACMLRTLLCSRRGTCKMTMHFVACLCTLANMLTHYASWRGEH